MCGPPQHRVEHRLGEPAGEGVLLARVVAAEQHDVAVGCAEHGLGAVAEPRLRAGHVPPRSSDGGQGGVPADRAESDDVIKAVEWVTAHVRAKGWPAVVNMSLVTPRYPELDARVQASINSGITYVVAAGNVMPDYLVPDACHISPAHIGDAVTVGNVDPGDDKVAATSFIGSCVDLFAPGVNILSASPMLNAGGNVREGTSMATAHVSGVAALYLETTLRWPGRSALPRDVGKAIGSASVRFPSTRIWPWTNSGYPGSPDRLLHWGAGDINGVKDAD